MHLEEAGKMRAGHTDDMQDALKGVFFRVVRLAVVLGHGHKFFVRRQHASPRRPGCDEESSGVHFLHDLDELRSGRQVHLKRSEG